MTVNARAGGWLDIDAGGGSSIVINTGAVKKMDEGKRKWKRKNSLDGSALIHQAGGLITFVARGCLHR